MALLAACGRSSATADAAVDACIRAMDAAATSDASAGERAASIAAGCAALYAETECRKAHEAFGEGDPSQKARLLTERCAHAYCDKLPSPKPALCSGVPVAGPSELALAWAELRYSIWKRDLGEASAARLNEEVRRRSLRGASSSTPPIGGGTGKP